MATKAQGAKARKAVQVQEEQVVNSVKDLSLDVVSQSIAETQVAVQQVLAELSAKVMTRIKDLRDLETAIDAKEKELNDIFGIEAAAKDLDQHTAAVEQEKAKWAEEQQLRQRLLAEEKAETLKQRTREAAEYKYRTEQENRKAEDTMAYELDQKRKANKEKQEQLEKQWNEREAELKRREQELAELRQFKADYPENVKKEANAQVAVATNSVKKEYETRMTLAAKDAELAHRLAEQEIRSRDLTITKQQEQIQDLKTQLEAANAAVKEISAKALESASNRQTADALQRLMEKEQGSNRPAK
jgi:hypothetical protein